MKRTHAPAEAAPTHGGVEALPHGLPEGLYVPSPLRGPQRCSPLHAAHLELVRAQLREGEFAILSTAPAGIVPLPGTGGERLAGGLLLLFAAYGLATALTRADGSAMWLAAASLLAGVAALVLLRAPARRQAALLRRDYVITNRRLHTCTDGRWEAVNLAAVESVATGEAYGGAAGAGDLLLLMKDGGKRPTPCLTKVEHAECLQELLLALVARERLR